MWRLNPNQPDDQPVVEHQRIAVDDLTDRALGTIAQAFAGRRQRHRHQRHSDGTQNDMANMQIPAPNRLARSVQQNAAKIPLRTAPACPICTTGMAVRLLVPLRSTRAEPIAPSRRLSSAFSGAER